MRMMSKPYGSVLMETVIVMPLHLIAFLSVCWLGELTVDRVRLASVDQTYSVVKDAGVGSVSLDTLRTTAFRETQDLTLTDNSPTVTVSDTNWWKQSVSRVQLTQTQSSWFGGMKFLAEKVFGLTDGEISSNRTMAAQGEPSATDATAVTYLKNSDYKVSGYTVDGNTVDRSGIKDGDESAVVTVFKEPYISGLIDTSFALSDVAEYTRNSNLRNWSN